MKKKRLTFLLGGLALCGGLSIPAQAATEPTEGGTYFLYNVDAGRFLMRGNDWGTRSSLLDTGEAVTLTTLPSGAYKLGTVTNGNSTCIFLGNDNTSWMDGDNNMEAELPNRCYEWNIEKQGNQIYLIKASSASNLGDTQYFGMHTDEGLNDSRAYGQFVPTAHNNPAVRWIFLSQEEYDQVQPNVKAAAQTRTDLYKYIVSAKAMGYTGEEISEYEDPATDASVLEEALATLPAKLLEYAQSNATEENPMDLSFLIQNASCGVAYTSWDLTGGFGNNGVNGNTKYLKNGDCFLGGRFFERWVSAANNGTLDDCQISQNLTGLPIGSYKIGVDVNAEYQDDHNREVTGVQLFAKAKEETYVECHTADVAPEYFETSFVSMDGTATIGIRTVSTTANWISFDNFKLYYIGVTLDVLKESLNTAITEAKKLQSTALTIGQKGILTQPLADAEAAQSSSDKATVENATNTLLAAIDAVNGLSDAIQSANDIAEAYEAVLTNSTAEETDKTTYGNAISIAKSAVNDATDTETIDAAMAALEKARQEYVMVAAPTNSTTFDMTFLIQNAAVTSTDGWTNARTDNREQYTDAPDNIYFDTYNETRDMFQNITVRPGVYKLKAATRAEASLGTGYIYINETKADVAKQGNQGNTLGAGWAWTTTAETSVYTNVKIGFYSECGGGKWAGADNFKLEFVRPLTDDETLSLAKESLQQKFDETSAMNLETNVGNAAFQIPTSLAQAVRNALLTAGTTAEKTDATLEEVDNAIKALDNAVAAFNAPTLNAPADGQVFNIEITTGDNWKFKNLPLTLHAGGASFYPGRDADCYAQTLMLKQVEGNLYTISTVFADGKEHYLCTAQTIGTGNTKQIRTTDDASKALLIKVIPTDAQGVYNLWNTEANGLLGCQDGDDKASGGLYGTSSHPTFAITETDMPSVTLTTAAEWATLILPFNAEIPDGLEVYSCAGTDTEGEDATLTLEAVETIAANTPYIVKAAAYFTHTFEGFGAAETTTYTAGMLTGTFAEMEAVEGTYVLQNQAEKGVGFYKVETEKPVVKANRAYLNAEAAPAGSNVQAFILKSIDGDGTTTGIDGTVAEADATVNVYNLNGILVRQNVKMSEALDGLQKGIYIVNGTKKAVK